MNKNNIFSSVASLLVVFSCGLVFASAAMAQVSVDFGSEYVFNPATTDFVAVAKLSENKVVMAYKDIGDIGYGRAVIATISDKSISYGAEYLFNSAATDYVSVAALSEDKFVVVFRDTANNSYGTAVIGSVSGNVISYGAEFVFNTAKTEYINVLDLSANKFVVLYRDASNADLGTAVIGTVSNNAVSFSDEYIFNPSATAYISAAKISDTRIIIAFKDNDGFAKAAVGKISDTSLNFGSEFVYNYADTDSISVSSLGETKSVISYRDIGGLSYGRAIVGKTDDQAISYGAEYAFTSGAAYYTSAKALTDSRFIISYKDGTGTGYGTLVVGDIDDTAISYSPEFVFNSSQTATTTVVSLATNKFLIAYIDSGNLAQGTAVIGQIAAVCGNNILETSEECDDGNKISGDSCSALCVLEAVCGNSVIDESEECDDGDTESGDGCSAMCMIEAEPVPGPGPEPEESDIKDGDLIRNPNAEGLAKFDTYIVKLKNNKKFKRLILSPHVFESYGHLSWDNILDVSQSVLDQYTDSALVRAYDPSQSLDDEKIYQLYPQGDSGTKSWVDLSSEEFENKGYDWDAVYFINQTDRDAYQTGNPINS